MIGGADLQSRTRKKQHKRTMPEISPPEKPNNEDFFLRWDTNNLEIKTLTVEKTLEPLVLQVTTLVNSGGVSRKRKGKSKRAHVLVAAVEAATSNFVEQGKIIAQENPEISKAMLDAVEGIKKAGANMSSSSRDFAEQPCTSGKRTNMVKSARVLLGAVTRLLILADMVDVHRLLKRLKGVEDDLEDVKNASSNDELVERFRAFSQSTEDLINQAAKRQQELKDPRLQDDLASARAVLKRSSAMLLTASKAYVRHPELAAAKANRDYVLRQVCEAVNTINDVAQGKSSRLSRVPQDKAGEIASALDNFDVLVDMSPLDYNEIHCRPSLEEQLESIISGAALMADSYSTRDDRKQRIVLECNAVRDALQDLLTEYMDNLGHKEPSESLNQALGHVHEKTQDLRRQLRKAVVDHVADNFIETEAPLEALVTAAREGDVNKVEELSKDFAEHAKKLVEVAHLACSMSSDEEGVKMVRYAAAQIEELYPQVQIAAEMLSKRHKSKVAQENMDAFKEAWENQLGILMDSVDDITTVDDFLAVSENHILEDVKVCVEAINEGDYETFSRVAGNIRSRSSRVCDVVTAEMDDYESCVYTDNVMKAVKMLRDQALPDFGNCVDLTSNSLKNDPAKEVDENEFIDASHLVYDGVREIRLAVVMNKGDDELDPEEFESTLPERDNIRSSMLISTDDATSFVDEYPEVSGIMNAREAMKNLSNQDKDRIAEEVENFQEERKKFDKEVSKWDDSSNDIVVLAKHVCVIMIQMTDFTRGKGPLKTTLDVIEAAKKISVAGTKLDRLAREIAEKCPESGTKNDMLAYLDRIALYCQQLNITSKVKADVQSISGNLVVSGLDSATSLIQAAKNLMGAVVSTVKCCYVASTKYRRQMTNKRGDIVWKMKAPEKKPLVRRERPEDVKAKIRKGSQKKPAPVAQFLRDFERIEEFI